MSEASCSDVKKPIKQPSLLEAVLVFIESFKLKAFGYLSMLSNIFKKFSTPQKNLSDLPVDVVALIIEKSDYRQQLKLRKVSKSLRALVDKQEPACKSIEVECCKNGVIIKIDGHSVAYTNYHDCTVDCGDAYKLSICNVTVKVKSNFMKIAFDNLASILKNQKLQLEKFSVLFFHLVGKDIEEYCIEIRNVFESANHQVSVKKVILYTPSASTLLSILPYLKPGLLESVLLCYVFGGDDLNMNSAEMDQLARLEQWKQAEKLELFNFFDRFPIKYATHFEQFIIFEAFLNSDQFARIRNGLSNLDNFRHCTLCYCRFSIDPDSIHQLLGTLVHSFSNVDVFHSPIPDSDYYFEFKMATHNVEIERKKKN